MSCTRPNSWHGKNYTHHSQLSDEEFVEAFEKASLHPKLFNHEAHIRLAWVYLQKYGEEKAVEKTCAGIAHFDAIYGNGDKFHATITVAAVKAVHHFNKKSKSTNFFDFMEAFPRLKTAFKELLEQHYTPEVLTHEKAKTDYIPPDLLPFD
ncbi:hypothetical protein [Flagellimonas olearia]|nr:hypothetical protein [Allomuricauda olearia]